MASLYTIYQIYLNSRWRSSGDISNFTTFLPDPITCEMLDFNSEFRLVINQAQIPYSFHEINNFNNSVDYNITRGITNLNGTVTIPNGTYDIVSMATIFTSSLTASITALIPLYIPVIAFVYSYDKNKLTFSLTFDTTATVITLISPTAPAFNQVLLSLGFNSTATLNDISPLESFISCNVSPSRSIYILSNNLINGKSYDGYVSPLRTSNVLLCIPINVSRYNYINYNPPIPTVNVLTNKTIDKINLYLQTESLDRDIPDLELNFSANLTFEHYVFLTVSRVLSPPKKEEEDKKKLLTDERSVIIDELNNLKQKLSDLNIKDVKSKKTNKTESNITDNNSTNSTS